MSECAGDLIITSQRVAEVGDAQRVVTPVGALGRKRIAKCVEGMASACGLASLDARILELRRLGASGAKCARFGVRTCDADKNQKEGPCAAHV